MRRWCLLKCQHCGTGNPDTAKFCRKCGKPIVNEQQQLEVEPEPLVPSSSAIPHKDTICPYCGKENCQPMMRNTTNVKTSGYSWGSGCCGMLLMGPFGLLCGLCGTGSRVDSRNETIWICQSCGKEHLSQKAALNKAQISIESCAMAILFIALLLSVWYHYGSLTWLVPVAWGFSPILAWYMISEGLSTELGYPFKEALPPDISVAQYLLIAEAATILVLLFSGPLVIGFLSNL